MSMKIWAVGAALAASLFSGRAHATVYTLIGQGISPATATGTITTDGTLGVLSLSDITAIDITVADGTNSVNLSSTGITVAAGTDSVDLSSDLRLRLAGADLSATSDGLYFNYASSDDSYFVLLTLDYSRSAYCMASAMAACGMSISSEYIVVANANYQGPTQSGTVRIATTNPTGVPEPASWALMLVGVGGLGAAIRSGRRGVAASI